MSQYLILHKVRGEPSFDTAEMVEVGDEAWWITNSGYRAYPYQFWPLTDICARDDHMYRSVTNFKPEALPDDWPDHFQISEAPAKSGTGTKIDLGAMLSKLIPPIRRRI